MSGILQVIPWLLGAIPVVAGPIGLYALLSRRRRDRWPLRIERWASHAGGAYRGGVLTKIDPGRAPPLVVATALLSLYLGAAWLPSLPLVFFGMMVELADHAEPGGATLLGIPGILLSGAILVAGVKLARKSPNAATWAHRIGVWAALHNVAVLVVIFVGSAAGEDAAIADFALDKVGGIALGYALVSFLHAAMLIGSARVVRTADALRAAQDTELSGMTAVGPGAAPAPPSRELAPAYP
jgi:hypothetical protein